MRLLLAPLFLLFLLVPAFAYTVDYVVISPMVGASVVGTNDYTLVGEETAGASGLAEVGALYMGLGNASGTTTVTPGGPNGAGSGPRTTAETASYAVNVAKAHWPWVVVILLLLLIILILWRRNRRRMARVVSASD